MGNAIESHLAPAVSTAPGGGRSPARQCRSAPSDPPETSECPPEQHRDGSLRSGFGEVPEEWLFYRFPCQQVALESVFARRDNAEVCLDDAGIDDLRRRPTPPSVERIARDPSSSMRNPSIAARLVPVRRGRQSALFREQPDAARRLAFEVLPRLAATDPARDDYLSRSVAKQAA